MKKIEEKMVKDLKEGKRERGIGSVLGIGGWSVEGVWEKEMGVEGSWVKCVRRDEMGNMERDWGGGNVRNGLLGKV